MAESANPVSMNTPKPGTKIVQDTPTKAYREPYVEGVEFDHSAATWTELTTKYPNAWTTYYNEPLPAYSAENSVKLGEAIRFWQYMNVGETITYDKDFNGNTYGSGETRVATYAPEGANSGTYSHPDGFYDPGVYSRTVGRDNNGDIDPTMAGELPRVGLDGGRVIGEGPLADLSGGAAPLGTALFSEEYVDLTEYKTTHRVPTTPYEWGGPYAVGGKYKLSNDN